MDDATGILGELLRTPVRALAYESPLRLAPDTPMGETVRLMKNDQGGSVIVMHAGDLAGIFTDRDVMLRIDYQDPNWREIPLGTLMSKKPVSISSGSTLGKALQMMRTGHYRHLPILTDDGNVLAVLSISTIVAFIAESFPQEFMNLPPT